MFFSNSQQIRELQMNGSEKNGQNIYHDAMRTEAQLLCGKI